ncbi:MAG: PDZ domain-containing protein [Candidatus Krumholzibacteria bacterium]|nr:PDZ domain-containing protein [Candidatus Krumholzibacteria bacterium]
MKWPMQNRLALAAAAAVAVALAATAVALPGGKDDDEKVVEKSRGYLGVYMQELTKKLRKGLDVEVEKGVLVSGVADDSPAEKAGIEDGDVIVKFAGKSVASPDDLGDLVRDTKPGTEVSVELVRDGKTRSVTLAVGEQPDDLLFSWSGDDFDWADLDWAPRAGRHVRAMIMMGPRLGVHTAELNEDLAGYFGAKPGEGVLVLEVNEESVAEEAGVKAGDVIQKIGDEEVGDVDDLREALGDFEEGDEFEIALLRKGKKQTLKATMDDSGHAWKAALRAPRVHMNRHRVHAPRVRVERWDDNDLREEMDDLRRELDELKKELEKKDS